MKNILLYILLTIIPATCFAGWTTTGTNSIINSEVKAVNIFFMAPVNNDNISDLIASIIEINGKYKEAKNINIYISTMGGDMNSAFAAYKVIKSSHIPVTTINLSTVASAGDIIFCAAKQREAFINSQFIFHPISYWTNNSPNYKDITPAKLANIKNMIKGFQLMATPIYQKCTNFTVTEIHNFLRSEGDRYYINGSNGIQHKLVTGIISNIKPTPVTYYINNNEN